MYLFQLSKEEHLHRPWPRATWRRFLQSARFTHKPIACPALPTEHTEKPACGESAAAGLAVQAESGAASLLVTVPICDILTSLPFSSDLCDIVKPARKQPVLLSPAGAERGTRCCAEAHFKLLQIEGEGCKRRYKTYFHVHWVNAFCSFTESKKQKDIFPSLL